MPHAVPGRRPDHRRVDAAAAAPDPPVRARGKRAHERPPPCVVDPADVQHPRRDPAQGDRILRAQPARRQRLRRHAARRESCQQPFDFPHVLPLGFGRPLRCKPHRRADRFLHCTAPLKIAQATRKRLASGWLAVSESAPPASRDGRCFSAFRADTRGLTPRSCRGRP